MQFATPITVTVRRLAVDAFGDETITSVITLPGCALVQKKTYETTGDFLQHSGDFRQDATTQLRLLAPRGADIQPGDEVVLPDGERYRVRGDSASPRSPFTGWEPGAIVEIEKVKG